MPSDKTILIVEDNSVNRQILCNILREEYQILEAENGQQALALLQEKTDAIAVVLLDILMPVMDGYALLHQMHKDRALANIPVLVASGQEDAMAEVKALALGANDYITKPYKPDVIRHKVANTILLRETASVVNAAHTDVLTGLYTKEYFYQCAAELIRQNPEQKFDVICCDIERFKLVNDLYGVQEGDALLRHLSGIVKAKVQGHGICCRMSGDIFYLMIKRPKEYLAEEFSSHVEYTNQYDMHLRSVIKYGIYQIDDVRLPISIMCDRAYLAVESVKGKFDVYYAFYDESIRRKLLEEQFVLSNMESALKNGEFQVYYQPKYDLLSRTITSAEALVRWIHPEKGLIPPDRFIPIIEKNGFITQLDIFVWEEVCKTIRGWMDAGQPVVPISVNMSRADIYNPNIDQILIALVKKYRLSPQYLFLEITETAYMENVEQLTLSTHKLKKLGFIIEMDDFGSGYSSLNMLAELPIDILKLDIRFVQGDQLSNNRKSILSFIISLAKWLDLRIVAEGVETEDQVKLLTNLGCERAQGYYFSKPLPVDQFERLLLQSCDRQKEECVAASTIEDGALHGEQSSLLLLDAEASDLAAFEQAFADQYHVIKTDSMETSLVIVQKFPTRLSAVVLSLTGETQMDEIAQMAEQCNDRQIPVITLHTSDALIPECQSHGVAGCILKPYRADSLVYQVQNVILRTRIAHLEREKEINAAITEMKKRAEEDALTGLLNRAEFQIRVQDFFHYNKMPEGIFIMIDVDHFKKVNDAFGHISGDNVLREISKMLTSLFPETNIISRFGGDEFALFIPYTIEQTELEAKLQALCQTMTIEENHLQVACSAGVCFAPEYGMDYEQLYYNADIALLNAKHAGKSRYVIFEHGLSAPLYSQLEQRATALLNDVSDAMFVCDGESNEIIYVNNTACQLVNKSRSKCMGARCYEIFWDSCQNCSRCLDIDRHKDSYYEEDTVLKDGKTPVHVKAKLGEWDGKTVKIHYLQGIQPQSL
ncbi:EAL domain-containing protein [Butyricicoccus sp. Marseille-Q5471]|uniref:EAL domain-containing protein n=1 Tax=Butyricicoccus sp. Marseille-Q5471 TaxID=3039493 RepID=UPI0024BBF351|nr:EAL domain-containing protein [Butyricicoccus sp. Marseille-Q5471]